MARQRIIRPEFFGDERLAACSAHTRLLFAGLWGLADKRGRLRDQPPVIHGAVFPFEPDLNVDEMLDRLEEAGSILRYVVDGKKFIQVKNFERYQNPHPKEVESSFPAPPLLYRAEPRKATAEPGLTSFLRSFVPSVPDNAPSETVTVPGDPRPTHGEGAALDEPAAGESLEAPPTGQEPPDGEGPSPPNGNGRDDGAEAEPLERTDRTDPGGLLEAAKVRISGVMPPHAFATWIRPLVARGWDGDVFVIEAPTRQHREWVRVNHAARIKAAFLELGRDCPIRILARARDPATLHDGAL